MIRPDFYTAIDHRERMGFLVRYVDMAHTMLDLYKKDPAGWPAGSEELYQGIIDEYTPYLLFELGNWDNLPPPSDRIK